MLATILLLAAVIDPSDCRVGAYRLDDGSLVTIDPSDAEPRWHKLDGTLGVLHQAADGTFTSTLGFTSRDDGKRVSLESCEKIVFDKVAGHRIDFDIKDTAFKSGALELAGRLVLPKGDAPVPIVVLLHGSEKYSGRDRYLLQRMLPAEGVGVFVYDKRGTGKSQGNYSQDFSLLADDAVAAVREARRMAGKRAGRVGFHGGSQGGYVAPLAATRTPVDFVSVGFGLAVSPLEEDRQEIELEMKLEHHTQAEIDKALEVAAAAATILTSGFTKGFDEFDAVRNKYRGESWYKDLHGNFTVDFLPLTADELRARKSEFLVGTPMSYDAMPVLRRLKTPQLWELGALDLAAPSAETARRLKPIKTITVAMFPKAEHGIYEFEKGPDGARVQLRNSDGYFAMIRDFARDGRLHGKYGDSTISGP